MARFLGTNKSYLLRKHLQLKWNPTWITFRRTAGNIPDSEIAATATNFPTREDRKIQDERLERVQENIEFVDKTEWLQIVSQR